MNNPIVVIGIGEIGSVFARGFLRTGHPVYPVTRDMNLQDAAQHAPDPELVLIAVGETALPEILAQLPEQWRAKVALIQNELLPVDWKTQGYNNPTVMSVWFEKKPGQDVKVVVPSPAYGPHSRVLIEALQALNIPAIQLEDEAQLLFELVRKNYYILTTNIAGLRVAGTVSELWHKHEELARSVAADVHRIQSHLTGEKLDHEKLIAAMVTAFEGDPDHQCMGRSAPARLDRALDIAAKAHLDVPALQAIKQSL